jgi:hypothetical protein
MSSAFVVSSVRSALGRYGDGGYGDEVTGFCIGREEMYSFHGYLQPPSHQPRRIKIWWRY